jgi:hypothetical protein
MLHSSIKLKFLEPEPEFSMNCSREKIHALFQNKMLSRLIIGEELFQEASTLIELAQWMLGT